MEESPRKKQVSRVRRWIGNSVGLLLLSCGLWAWLVEAERLEVTHHTVVMNVRSPLKVAHVTDLHVHRMGRRERALIESLVRERPDLIVLTGDTVDDGRWESARSLLSQMSQMHAPLGVWLVDGNWEHWRPAADITGVLPATSVQRLVDASSKVRDDLAIVGFDDATGGAPDAMRAMRDVPGDRCVIALFHSPVWFDTIADRLPACSLSLSGHTHGGQVRLPLVGPLWLPPGSGNYLAGWHQKGRAKMYVSRGVGTSLLDIRFLCRPELAYITLVPG